MEKISQFFLASLLLLTLLPARVRCDGDDDDIITPHALPDQCFKVFQEKAKAGPNNLNLIISHETEFGVKEKVPATEFHFRVPHAKGRIAVLIRASTTFLTRQFRLDGFVAIENVMQMKFVGDIKKSTALEACEAYANDMAEFLKPQPKFKTSDVVAKYKAKFEEIFAADGKIKLVEVFGGSEATTGSEGGAGGEGGNAGGEGDKAGGEGGDNGNAGGEEAPGRMLTNLPIFRPTLHDAKGVQPYERKLVGSGEKGAFYQIVDTHQRKIGYVDFSQINKSTLVITTKIDNQFTSKTFVSTADTLEKAIRPVESMVAQMKDVNIPEELSTDDMKALVTKLLTDIDCVEPAPDVKTSDYYAVVNWVKGQKIEQASQEESEGMDLRRERRLAGENCPFNVLTASLLQQNIDGFPSLQVYFEGNTQFPVPIYLDYFLTINSKTGVEEKVKFLFTQFVEAFKYNEKNRQEEQKKDDAYDAALKEYNRQIQEDLPGSELLKKPEREQVPTLTVVEAAAEVQKKILAQNVATGSKVILSFNQMKPADETGAQFQVMSASRLIMIVTVFAGNVPRIHITFFHYPNYQNERKSTYQMDISSDARLHQLDMLDNELARYFKQEWKFIQQFV